ncbi:MOS1T transposase, partial [Pseudoatta argentina]
MNKSAAEAHRILVDVYSEHALTEQTCRKWFARFKAGDFDLDDKERPGQPKKFEDNDLQALLNENSCQTLKELSTSLEVDFSTIGKRLKSLGMIQKEGHWVPYELKPRDLEPHVGKPVKTYLETLKWEVLPHPPYSPDIAPSDFHLFRSMAHGLADRRFHSYEEAQKWIDSWIASKDMSFFRRGIHVLPERWEKVVSSDGQYFK